MTTKLMSPVVLSSIVSAERDGEGNVSGITEEAVHVLVGEDEEDEDPSLARPGAKMARLRATLQQQIERQRDQQWAKRQQEVKLYEDEEFYEGLNSNSLIKFIVQYQYPRTLKALY